MADHEKLREIHRLEAQFGPRFTHLSEEWHASSVSAFREADHRQSNTLRSFWDATVALGRAAMQRVPATDSPSAIIVCIPRGAYPLAEGARNIIPHADVLVTNDGGLRTDGPLIPDDVPPRRVGRHYCRSRA